MRLPPEKFTVGLVQMSATPEPAKNLQRAIDRVAKRGKRRARKSSACRNFFRHNISASGKTRRCSILAEPIPGPTTEKLSRGRQETKIVLIASLFEKRAPGVYHNTAAIFDADGTLRGIYRKMHIPDDPLYYEKFTSRRAIWASRRSTPTSARSARWSAGTSGIPKARASRPCRAQHCFSIPTAIGWHPAEKAEFGEAQYDAWRTIQRAHAIANGVYVAVVNRVGFETWRHSRQRGPGKGLEFWGGSFLCDPFGRVIAEAPHDKEEILIGEVDSESAGRHAPQLAFPARPPHRQLRPESPTD